MLNNLMFNKFYSKITISLQDIVLIFYYNEIWQS